MPSSFTHKFLRSTLFKLGIPFLCATPSSALAHHATPLPMLSPMVSTQCLQHSPKAVQNIRISWLIWHMNMSITVSSYTAIIIIGIQPLGQCGQRPEFSQANGMALVCCILGKLLGVVCHCFPLRLDVPTFATRCLHFRHDTRDPSGERWNCVRECCPGNFA